MTAIQELKNWINEFKNIAQYHNGDHKQGMLQVLDGLTSQVNTLANKEQIEILNLKNLSQLELLKLNSDIEVELKEYDKRDKTKAFRIMAFGSATYFSTIEKTIEHLYYLLDEYDNEEMVTDEPLTIGVDYMNIADFKQYVRE